MKGRILNIVCRFSRTLLLTSLLITSSGISYCWEDSNENEIKALFVLNFIKYVNWPPEINKSNIMIGVAGETAVYNALVKVIQNRSEKKNIRVEKITAETAGYFHIVFISREETSRMERWIQKYTGKGVLLISDDCKNSCGAAINLINVDNKIRFEINTFGAQRGGIKISSKLMELATSVE
jgi:hypothetical protein